MDDGSRVGVGQRHKQTAHFIGLGDREIALQRLINQPAQTDDGCRVDDDAILLPRSPRSEQRIAQQLAALQDEGDGVQVAIFAEKEVKLRRVDLDERLCGQKIYILIGRKRTFKLLVEIQMGHGWLLTRIIAFLVAALQFFFPARLFRRLLLGQTGIGQAGYDFERVATKFVDAGRVVSRHI